MRLVAWSLASCLLPRYAFAGDDDPGKATTLVQATFDDYIVAQRGKERLALVMFHVNWCKVCQKTLPKFAAAADLVEEKGVAMDFAHVDCTSDKSLCQRFNVKGYPTIKLFMPKEDAEPLSYRSARSEDGFLKYAQRMTLPPVRQVASSADLQQLLRDEIFSAFVATADDAADVPAGLLAAAEAWRDRHIFAVAPKVQDLLPTGIAAPEGASLAVLSSSNQQWAGVLSNGKAKPSVLFFSGDLSNATEVNAWVEKIRFPGIWILGENNFYAFTHASRRTAMIAVDPAEVSGEDEQILRSAATALADGYLFGVLDGIAWADHLTDFNIAKRDLPRILVTEDDFEAWYEDINELKLATLEDDLRGLASGKKQLLRQGRTVLGKIFFYKREAWRYMVLLHAYSGRGPKETFLALCMVIAGTFAVMAAGWCMMSCCSILLSDEQDIDFSSAQQRRPKKD